MSTRVAADPVLRRGPVAIRFDRRMLATCAGLLVALVVLITVGLCFGARWATPWDVLQALAGYGDSSVVVQQWRLPRVVAAAVFGAALGLSGAIFQSLTRNPLGSPDVLGLDAGAYTGVLLALMFGGGAAVTVSVAAGTGGLVVAGVLLLLTGTAAASGLRLVVLGIAVNAIVTALNSWLVLSAELDVAIAGTAWSAGSLNGIGWADLTVPIGAIAVLTAGLAVCARAVHQTELGDHLAVTTGVPLGRLRPLVVLIAVGLTAAVTATAGPVVFVALAAPQIGRRLARSPGIAFAPAALTGAVLLLGADVAAQVALAPIIMPVGVVTTIVGGAYLVWLLIKEARIR